MLVVTGILVDAFLLNTLFVQHVLGASTLETGVASLPPPAMLVTTLREVFAADRGTTR